MSARKIFFLVLLLGFGAVASNLSDVLDARPQALVITGVAGGGTTTSGMASSSRTSSVVDRPGRRPGPRTIASCSWSRISPARSASSTRRTS